MVYIELENKLKNLFEIPAKIAKPFLAKIILKHNFQTYYKAFVNKSPILA